MILSDLHTHTVYGDGKNTPEEMISEAVKTGMESIGFSEHAYTPFDLSYCMSGEDTLKYRDEIYNLKELYSGKINIFCGIEKDLYSEDCNKYDYVIGSVHYVKKDGAYLEVDGSASDFEKIINEYYGGNAMKFVGDFFEQASLVPQKTKCDIVGHFDLITKFNDGNVFFDIDSAEYKSLAAEAVREAAKSNPIFEVNTGGISRGYKKNPYPSKFILDEILNCGCRVMLSSDSHTTKNLCFGFSEAAELLKECGFKSIEYMVADGFKSVQI